MCVVSNVGDQYKVPTSWPTWPQGVPFPHPEKSPTPIVIGSNVSRKEFEDLKREVEFVKKLLEEAKNQDIAEGNPDCEMDEKVAIIKQIADMVGVNLDHVFTKPV